MKLLQKHYKKILVFLAGALLFAFSLAVSYAYFTYQKIVIESDPFEELTLNQGDLKQVEDPLDPYNILLLGYGGLEHSGGLITDTMIVAHVQPRDKRVTLISVPRDIWVPLDLGEALPVYRKINHAYALGNQADYYTDRPEKYQGERGGATMAEDVIEMVTGLPIRHFIAINFQAFEEAINNLGGIEVDVPVSFVDEYYPIKGLEDNPCGKTEEEIAATEATLSGFKLEQEFKCRYERLAFEKGPTEMDGGTALKFVRSRHSEIGGNDFGRAQRQQKVVEAIRDKLLSLDSLPRLVPLINALSKQISTDIGISAIKQIWTTHQDLESFEIQSLVLSTDNVLVDDRSADRQYILVPSSGAENWAQIHEFIEENLATDSAVLAE